MEDFILSLREVIKSPLGILIVQRSDKDRYQPGIWEFPGGKFETGEKLKNSLKREVEEETGLVGTAIGAMKVIKKTLEKVDSGKYAGRYAVTLYIFGEKNKNYKIVLSSEHQDYKWVADKYDIRNLDLDPVTQEILEEIFNQKSA